MTPTPEQVQAAREWLNGFSASGWQVRDNTNGVIEVCAAKVATLLATREAAVRERCAKAERERDEAIANHREALADLDAMRADRLHAIEALDALDVLRADAAAMRLALEVVRDWYGLDGDGITDPVRGQVATALTSTAGEHVAAVYRAAVEQANDLETAIKVRKLNAGLPENADISLVAGPSERRLIAAVDKAQGRTE